jgi:hypothetical protein
MSEIVLHISDDINLEKVVSFLAPYIKNAEIKQTTGTSKGKIWDGDMPCLQDPWTTDSFAPLKREDIYDRQGIS